MNVINNLYRIGAEILFYKSISYDDYIRLLTSTEKWYNNKDEEIEKDKQLLSYLYDIPIKYNRQEQIIQNLETGNFIIAMIRDEIYDDDFNPLELLQKLSPLISMIQVGMYSTAIEYLTIIETDTIITDIRVLRWSNLLNSSNKIIAED